MEMRLARLLDELLEAVYDKKPSKSPAVKESESLLTERRQTILERQRKAMDKVDAGKLDEFVKSGDGHSIIAPEEFTDMGFLPEWADLVSHKHESDGTPKGTIFGPGGEVQKELVGIWSLTMLYHIAETLGIDPKKAGSYLGRGFQARALGELIVQSQEYRKLVVK